MALTQSIAQTGHGFAVGDVVRFNGTNYVKAQADSAANAEAIGMVSAVVDSNNFTLTTDGKVTGLVGLTAGGVYFLSPSSAGVVTATEPSTVGQVSKPVLIAVSTTVAVFFNWRGIVIGADVATQAELDAHLNDTVDAHDATAISFAPAGTIAATTVQAAIEEVASEAGGGGGAFDALVVKTADESVTASTTLQDDNELLFAIGNSATEVWFVEFFLNVVGSATMDFKFSVTVPAAASAKFGGGSGTGISGFSGFAGMGGGSSTGNLIAAAGTPSPFPGNTDVGYQIQGWIYGGGTAGNVVLQWAQNTSDGSALTVKARSFLRANKLVA